MHQGRAHKLALEPGSAHCFYSCGEDGVVRHFDLREPQYGNRKLLTLEAGYRHWQRRVEIYAVAINPSTPWQMALATGDEYVRVYDTRYPPLNITAVDGSRLEWSDGPRTLLQASKGRRGMSMQAADMEGAGGCRFISGPTEFFTSIGRGRRMATRNAFQPPLCFFC